MARINSRINLSRAVFREAMDETIEVHNFDAGMRIGGRWVQAPAASAGLTASVQPGDGEKTQALPEGLRTRETIDVFALTTGATVKPLKRVEGKRPSEIVWRGKTFVVEDFDDFSELGSYWYAFCVARDQ